MGSQKFTSIKLSDSDLLRALTQITASTPQLAGAAVTFQFGESGSSFNVDVPKLDSDPLLADIRTANSALLHRVVLQGQGYNVAVVRGPGADEVTASFPDQQQPDVLRGIAKFLSVVHYQLRAYGRTAATDEVLGKELAEFYRQREELLTKLERVHAEIVESNEAYRERLEERFDQRRRELDDDHQQKIDASQAEYARKHDELAARERELQTRIATLDDRSSTHARRQVREDLKRIVAERTASFHLSKDTVRKRLPVHLLFLGLILASSSLFAAALLGYLPVPSSLPSWFAAFRLPLIAVALAASIVFYIRWTDHWFRQHADEEMRLKRLELDIDRATWVVEMALEWKREKGAEIPSELIERLSRNLFEPETFGRPRHPTEDLASALLGASAGLSLNIPGVAEAKLDRKGIKQFKDAVDDKR